MRTRKLQSCSELIEYIDKIGFLPLLGMGINGWSAEEVMDQEFQYTPLPDGGWEWPLWKWKGTILQESGCAYGKFFDKSSVHQPRMVARFLQLPPQHLSLPRRGKRRGNDSCHAPTRRQPHHPRTPCSMRLHRSQNERTVRHLCLAARNGRLHRHRGFYLSPRPPRTGIRLGLVTAHYT